VSASWESGQRLGPITLDLTLRRAVQAVAGTRDYYPVHHDERVARESGARTIFFNTMFLQAFIGRAANEWFGNDAFLRMLDVAMVGSAYVGTRLTAEGTVVGLRKDVGRSLVDVDVSLNTEDGQAARARFTMQLPPSPYSQTTA
jgi:acyl dehydratase